MLKVGITGGIGSGKSTICRIFTQLNIPIYYADLEAKKLMNTDEKIIEGLKKIFGKQIYTAKNELDTKKIAQEIFSNKEKIQEINQLVHPRIASHFQEWASGYSTHPYVLKEAAILFESGSYKQLNFNILVTSPIELRIERCIKRDNTSAQEIEKRIQNQWPDSEKQKLADFSIHNDEKQLLIPQILALHQNLCLEAQKECT